MKKIYFLIKNIYIYFLNSIKTDKNIYKNKFHFSHQKHLKRIISNNIPLNFFQLITTHSLSTP